jgi:F0F1-type ATP synthase assembly protein I
MALDKFVLMLLVVVAAAGVTIWLGMLLAVAMQWSIGGMVVLLPGVLAGYVAFRVLMDRMKSSEDDYYDGIEK